MQSGLVRWYLHPLRKVRMRRHERACDMEEEFEDTIDWGDEAEAEVVASCDLSNPDYCESCQ